MTNYGMPTQGGGLVHWDEQQRCYIFVHNAPYPFCNGDPMPDQWSIAPTLVKFEPMNKEQIQNLRNVLLVQIGLYAKFMTDNMITTYRDRLQDRVDRMERAQNELRADIEARRPDLKKEVISNRDLSDLTNAVLARLS